MLKVVTNSNDKEEGVTIVLGLSRANVERLMRDQPIPINMEELGLGKGMIYIVGGETEQAIADSLDIKIPVRSSDGYEGRH